MAFKYTGELSKKIRRPLIGALMTQEEMAAVAKAIVEAQYRKMALLFDAHGVENGDWESLCFELAEAHVPGFKDTERRAGRPSKWDDHTRLELFLAVQKTGMTITAATKLLATIEPWKSLVAYTRAAETLRDEYTRVDPRFVQMYRDACALTEAKLSNSGRVARKLADLINAQH